MINMNNRIINLDLYELYTNRMDSVLPPLFKGIRAADGRARDQSKDSAIFYILLRILLACDAAHDFSAPRGAAGKKRFGDEKNELSIKIVEGLAKNIVDDVKNDDLMGYILSNSNGFNIVLRDTPLDKQLSELFNDDSTAKNTVNKIHEILGLSDINTLDVMLRTQPCADFKATDLINALDLVGNFRTGGRHYYLTLDAASDKTNLTPFMSEFMIRNYKRSIGCSINSERIDLYNTLASDYDAANDNALSKLIKSYSTVQKGNVVGVQVDTRNINFKITCGGKNIFTGDLIRENDDTVVLNIIKYFKMDVKKKVSSKDSSVNSITDNMIQTYKSNNTDITSLIKWAAFKTMGDFLQIISHLDIEIKNHAQKQSICTFMSFDIICTKIAALFSKNVFYEKKFVINESDKLDQGLHSFRSIRQAETERESVINLASRAALRTEDEQIQKQQRNIKAYNSRHDRRDRESGRSRSPSPNGFGGGNYFGKKKPKVKNISIKSLMTKLKSVGIKITRKRGKRRVYLSRPELIKKATAFRKLQLRAKNLKIRIMYKNRKGKYVYKTAKRLTSDIKKKMKKPVKKSNKKPVKKQMKQKFG